jgi:hypothetical protein
MKMRKLSGVIVGVLAAAAPLTAQAGSQDGRHLVARQVAEQSFIDSGEGYAALAMLGVRPGDAAAGAHALGDGELAELAARVQALRADPVAGQFDDRGWTWWAVAGLAAVLIIVLIT